MSRRGKQFIYGLVYLAIIGWILWSIYAAFLEPAPSCKDKKQNQGEQGIDCGGPCVACDLLAIKPIEVTGAPILFESASGSRALIFEVRNPNPHLAAAEFSYEVEFFGSFDQSVGTIKGKETIHANERRYIYEGNLPFTNAKLERAKAKVTSPKWQRENELSKPSIEISGGLLTEIKGEEVVIIGKVKNQTSIDAKETKVLAFIKNQFGTRIFPGFVILSNIKGFEERDFTIIFPKDSSIAKEVDPRKTEAQVSSY